MCDTTQQPAALKDKWGVSPPFPIASGSHLFPGCQHSLKPLVRETQLMNLLGN